jgi:hypothetical protein
MRRFRMPIAATAPRYFVIPTTTTKFAPVDRLAFGEFLEMFQAHDTVDEAIETAIDSAEGYPTVDFAVVKIVGTLKGVEAVPKAAKG